MKDNSLFDSLLEEPQKSPGPVTCLGMTFENDEARRGHFTEELRKKLQDSDFRKIEGFPIGSDEDILNLSNPPYYTPCPNPWIADFITEWEAQKPEQPDGYQYHREPFAADVSEGKNDPIYNAHSYHTKVPHKAIMRYILHYTEPGDIVFDGFCGTGMTGVAAQLCGNREVVMSLGYQVKPDGTILQEETDQEGKKAWSHISKLGARRAILNDLSPAATFIAHNYNTTIDITSFQREARRILSEVEEECRWMYETSHSDGRSVGNINYVVWSEINICSECGLDFVFYDVAHDPQSKKIRETFACPHCRVDLKKGRLDIVYESIFDNRLKKIVKRPKRLPVLVNYSVGRKRFDKSPDSKDIELANKIDCLLLQDEVPSVELPDMQMMRVGRMLGSGVTHTHHFFLARPAYVLGSFWKKVNLLKRSSVKSLLQFWLDSHLVNLSIRNRYRPNVSFPYNPLTGVFYVPAMVSEPCVLPAYANKLKRIVGALSNLRSDIFNLVQTCSASASILPPDSQDYIFTDPPFGENIYYSDLNFFVEVWYRIFTNTIPEAIIDRVRQKALSDYQKLMRDCFSEYYRILKPGRWITVEFSNSKAAVWNAIQTTLQEVGFVIGNVAALDKQQRSFQSITSPTAVKQDLVISAYKPNGGFERRFMTEAKTEDGVWDFIRTHLGYLPTVKIQANSLQFIPERYARILFDQMIAYFVRKGYRVPISSHEFQIGLSQRFIERDGMYFLPEQSAEYDRRKMTYSRILQASLFVSDEASAIQWLGQLLREKPQNYQDIHPRFIQETQRAWKKNESSLELSTLLEQNFLRYDGKGRVPEQIHAYLSTNWKYLRNLAKDDPALMGKARDRWYVPDPNKAGDLEKLREKALLKEFEAYMEIKKRLKVFRLEAVRAGFKKAWQERDYAVIVAVADKIPSNVLEEDPKLLMWYDQAMTRMGGE